MLSSTHLLALCKSVYAVFMMNLPSSHTDSKNTAARVTRHMLFPSNRTERNKWELFKSVANSCPVLTVLQWNGWKKNFFEGYYTHVPASGSMARSGDLLKEPLWQLSHFQQTEQAIRYFLVHGRSEYLMRRVSCHCKTNTPSSVFVCT